ncbi:MAG: cation:proton antiporter [Prochlorococcaceae cyanobacterium]|jgi:Kef-type K+ transport system membrane component KefB
MTVLEHNIPILAVGFALVLSAWIPATLPRLPLPAGVLELLLGMVIGPQGLQLAHVGPFLTSASAFGLGTLFLMAGLEIDPSLLRDRPRHRLLTPWLASAALALLVALGLLAIGGFSNPPIVALALTTTAMGILVPVLRDRSSLPDGYAHVLLRVATVGEVVPTVLFSLLLAGHRAPREGAILLAFAGASLLALLLVKRHQHRWQDLIAHSMHRSSQLPTRLVMGCLCLMVVLDNVVQINLALGGLVIGLLVREGMASHHRLRIGERLDGLGHGFFIPLFFLVSGMELDFQALLPSPRLWALVPLVAAAMLLVRGLPVWLLHRRDLAPRPRLALALDSSTQLPLVVAIAVMARSAGLLAAPAATVLVAAAVLTVLLFPAAASLLLRRQNAGTP